MRMLRVMLCAGMLAGCSATGGGLGLGTESDNPAKVRVSGVPFYPQEGFRCGPAAMAMALGWTGLDIKPAALEGQFYGPLKDPRKALTDAANRFGRLAYPISGIPAMKAELAAGHPVVVLQNLGVDSEPLWNCAVAVGYEGKSQVLLHAGDQAAKHISLRLFERLWSDTDEWGLVVLRPGEIPAAARQPDYVAASRQLEKAGRYWEAVLAYDAALSVWPSDTDSLMGLGSSLYLLGDSQGAADAFTVAATLAKDPGPARAALAQVSQEMAQRDDALAAAEKPLSSTSPLPARIGRKVKEVSN